MSIFDFTAEETNLIAIYRHVTREDTAAHIADMLPYMDCDMRRIAESAIQKLNGMSEEDYAVASFVADEDMDDWTGA